MLAPLAARRNDQRVGLADFMDAIDKITLGARRSLVLTPEDRRRTSYHESGHALIAMLTLAADPVRKISIIPRGLALGATLSTPDSDRVAHTHAYLSAKIRVALGGVLAEELTFGEATTSCESDIRELTEIARRMVGCWGMSSAIGKVAVLAPRDATSVWLQTSEETQRLVDQEVRRIVDDAKTEVFDVLNSNRHRLDALAAALLTAETLDEHDAYEAAGVKRAARSEIKSELVVTPAIPD